MRIDSHHHLWHYDPVEYDWIDAETLQHDFLLANLEREATAAQVQGTVVVQARQSLEETDWLLALAGKSDLIRGVVGWAPIASPLFQAELAKFKAQPLLKGLRHVVQGEPNGFLNDLSFNAGIAAMRTTGLVYDLLIFAHQLDEAIRFVDRHPDQQFVLDHLAKPAIAKDEYDTWSVNIGELAKRGNVVCKVSGMVTEADRNTWTPDSLQVYFDHVLEVFGPRRLMIGSDWPVLTVACSYQRWWSVVEQWIKPLTSDEKALLEGAVAARIYGLDVSTHTVKERR